MKIRQSCVSLKEIKSAFYDIPNKAMQRFRDIRSNDAMGDKAEKLLSETLYQLQLLKSSNEGFYEASVRITKGVPSIVGNISRIGACKDQPYCIKRTFPLLRKFYYCLLKPTTKEEHSFLIN